MRTGTWLTQRRRRHTSQPVRVGSIRSSTTRSGRSASKSRRASPPSLAVTTSMPSRDRAYRIASSSDSSSSTTITFGMGPTFHSTGGRATMEEKPSPSVCLLAPCPTPPCSVHAYDDLDDYHEPSRVPRGIRVRTTFEQRLEGLEAKLLQMGQLVQGHLDRTLEALTRYDTTLADEVIVRDDQIDRSYVEVEQEILRTLALQAPVAKDLRLVAGVLHINSHIERMGDLCVNMAKFVRITKDSPPVPEIQSTLVEMGGHAQRMVAAAMTCFARRDLELAERLPIFDQPLDRLNIEVFRQIERAAGDDRTLEWASRMVLVARYLERLGDHSVDIGEQVVFIVTGEVKELVPSKAVRAGVEDNNN